MELKTILIIKMLNYQIKLSNKLLWKEVRRKNCIFLLRTNKNSMLTSKVLNQIDDNIDNLIILKSLFY